MACVALGALASCGPSARPCVEDEECFGGEFCTEAGVCAVYDGRRRVGPVPGADSGRVRIPDSGNPFTPNEPDASSWDGGSLRDGGEPRPGEPDM